MARQSWQVQNVRTLYSDITARLIEALQVSLEAY